jgi:hypothetical protein
MLAMENLSAHDKLVNFYPALLAQLQRYLPKNIVVALDSCMPPTLHSLIITLVGTGTVLYYKYKLKENVDPQYLHCMICMRHGYYADQGRRTVS